MYGYMFQPKQSLSGHVALQKCKQSSGTALMLLQFVYIFLMPDGMKMTVSVKTYSFA